MGQQRDGAPMGDRLVTAATILEIDLAQPAVRSRLLLLQTPSLQGVLFWSLDG